MLFGILLTVQILICVSLAGLILIQRSEGGALGMGGGPSGFMSARGAGNLLTRLTAIFGILFFANSIGLTIVGNLTSKQSSAIDQVDTSKLPANTNLLPAAPSAQAPAAAQAASSAAPSLNDLPLAGASAPSSSQPARPAAAPAPSGSLAPSINLSMPSQTTTGNVGLSASSSTTPKPVSKPVQKTASSASSTSSVHAASAAPSSSASSTPASPASSQ